MNNTEADKLIEEHRTKARNDVNFYFISERAKYKSGFYIMVFVAIAEFIIILNQ